MIIAYSVLILTLFMQLVCYKRNLEFVETICFTVALLLLIVSFTISAFLPPTSATNAFTLVCMTLIGLTTPLSVWVERKNQVSQAYKKILLIVSGSLILLVLVGSFVNLLGIIQYVIVIFMGGSVAGSMLFIKKTSSKFKTKHQEKIEQYFASILLVVVPVLLLTDYITSLHRIEAKIGFTLPVIFIIMASNKLWDDIQRLALFNTAAVSKEHSLSNYALTKREQEVALLLIKGHTYKQVAEQLFISLPTVKTHASNIYKKCGVKSKIELLSLIIC
ncbi:helix-turn-helix transcriptional regulator [Microscilla marina]|nr:helix-turn-helix transcriptional regulator [Microscilla marina]